VGNCGEALVEKTWAPFTLVLVGAVILWLLDMTEAILALFL
jgi:hypothetical protein